MTLEASLDYETRPSLQVQLTATDPQDMSDSITLAVDVTDVDEPPNISFSAASAVTALNNARGGGREPQRVAGHVQRERPRRTRPASLTRGL